MSLHFLVQCKLNNNKVILFIAVAILYCLAGNSQPIKINYIDLKNYPVIEASFSATNSNGVKIFDSSVSDFLISENKQMCKVLEVANPQNDYQPISIVLVVDISLSMKGRHIFLAEEGLNEFVNQIPLETSEVAIAGFSDDAFIYSDFTQNKTRLETAIKKLHTIKGTDFDKAFEEPAQGAFAIGQNSKHKKVIVFITDGLGSPSVDRITSVAKDQGFTIYTMNMGLAIPDDLKTISKQTGGLYFEKIWNQEQVKLAASAILHHQKCTDNSTVKWLANLNCDKTKSVVLAYRKHMIELNYNVPSDKIGKVNVSPSIIQFGAAKSGMDQSQSLTVVPQNIPLTIQSMEMDSFSTFRLPDTLKFPLELKDGESFQTKVLFTARDAGIFRNNLRISFKECPPADINLRAGGKEQIKLIFPIGGETFVTGEDTMVLWDGVKKTKKIDIFYRLHEHDEWKFVDNSSNLKYLWTLPKDTSHDVQIRLMPGKFADDNLLVSAITEEGISSIVHLAYNQDGSQVITIDKDGFIKTWNTQNGKMLSSLGGFEANKAFLDTANERFYIYMKDEIILWDIYTRKQLGRATWIGNKVSTSYILPDGQEILVGANVTVDQAKNAKIWSGITPYKTFLFGQPEIKWASFTPNGTSIVTLDNKKQVKIFKTDSVKSVKTIQFKEDISAVNISPDGTKAVVQLPGELCVVDLNTTRELYQIPNAQYSQYSALGKYLITRGTDKSLNFTETSTGETKLRLVSPKFFKMSTSTCYVAYASQDSLCVFDLLKQKIVLQMAHKPLRLLNFDKSESKIYVLGYNNTIETYDLTTGEFIGIIEDFSKRVKGFVCSPLKPELAILMEDNRVEIWSPSINNIEDAISGKFSIISPKPSVIDTIQFGDVMVNSTRELVIPKFAWNSTKYPVSVKNIVIKEKQPFDVVSQNFPRKIEPNEQIDQEFNFTPQSIGKFETTVYTYTVTDTFTTIIQGNGVQQSISPLIKHIDFGKVRVGEHKDSLASLLVNIGKDTIQIKSISNFGPDDAQFKLLSEDKSKLAPGDTLKSLIRFSPVLRGKTTTAFILESADEIRITARGEGFAKRELILKGVTRNSADSVPIAAKVLKIDLGANVKMEEFVTGPDGEFQFKLAADRNYGVMAEKENFISTSLNIDLSETIFGDTLKRDIYLTEIKPGATIRLNCIFFEFGKAVLLPASTPDLNRILEIIKSNRKFTFEIHGYTDAVGSDIYNLNLSKLRAAAVLDYLVKNGVSKDRISIRFFGKNNPVATNETDEGRALNRRVELKVK
jgi:outer membrane protein OmpA-like peptidoglycan-associated protein/WD40 repeat protein